MGPASSGCHLAREGHKLVTAVKENHKTFVHSPSSCLGVLVSTHMPFDIQLQFAIFSRSPNQLVFALLFTICP